MKKLLTFTLMIFFFISPIFTKKLFAQETGICENIGGSCLGPTDYPCEVDETLDISECEQAQTDPDIECLNSSWYCVAQSGGESSDCIIAGATSLCVPNPEYNCSGEQLRNPTYTEFCRNQNPADCWDAEYSGGKCQDPAGYDCQHSWSGFICIPCTGSCDFSTETNCENSCDASFDYDGKSPNPLDFPDCGDDEIYTAIGCLSIANGNSFILFFLTWTIGIAGGIALILIVYSGVLILTSSGDPKSVQAGKQLLTAAIAGFILLLLSVYLLEFVGVNILNIQGF